MTINASDMHIHIDTHIHTHLYHLSFSSLPRVLVHEVGHFEIQVGRKRHLMKYSNKMHQIPPNEMD